MRYLIFIPIVLTGLAIPRGMPYDYFTLLRLANFTIFGILCYKVRNKNESWMLILGGLALLFNPLFPVHLSKSVWTILDIATILVVIIFFVKSKPFFQPK
jgi:hypothetical protein